MLQRKNNKWELHPYKVRYTNENSDDEDNVIRWADPSIDWWERTADKHEHITVHEIIDVEVTDEMEERFKEVEYMPEDYKDLYIDYVVDGETELEDDEQLPSNHPFNFIRLKNADESLLTKLTTQSESIDFYEDTIIEMAMEVYK